MNQREDARKDEPGSHVLSPTLGRRARWLAPPPTVLAGSLTLWLAPTPSWLALRCTGSNGPSLLSPRSGLS